MSHPAPSRAHRRSVLHRSLAAVGGALIGAIVGITLSASASAVDGGDGTGYDSNAGRLRLDRIELDDGSGWRVQGSGYLAGSSVTVQVAGFTVSARADEHGVVDVTVSDNDSGDTGSAQRTEVRTNGIGSDGDPRSQTLTVDAERDGSRPAPTVLGWAAGGAALPLLGRLKERRSTSRRWRRSYRAR